MPHALFGTSLRVDACRSHVNQERWGSEGRGVWSARETSGGWAGTPGPETTPPQSPEGGGGREL